MAALVLLCCELIRLMRHRWSGWGVGKALDSTQRGGECCSTHKPVADSDILGSEESKAGFFKCSLLQKEKTIQNIMPFKWSHLQSKPSTLPALLHLKNLRDPYTLYCSIFAVTQSCNSSFSISSVSPGVHRVRDCDFSSSMQFYFILHTASNHSRGISEPEHLDLCFQKFNVFNNLYSVHSKIGLRSGQWYSDDSRMCSFWGQLTKNWPVGLGGWYIFKKDLASQLLWVVLHNT